MATLAPTDFAAYSEATGEEFASTAAERAAQARDVLRWKESQQRERDSRQQESRGPSALDLTLAGGLITGGGWVLNRLLRPGEAGGAGKSTPSAAAEAAAQQDVAPSRPAAAVTQPDPAPQTPVTEVPPPAAPATAVDPGGTGEAPAGARGNPARLRSPRAPRVETDYEGGKKLADVLAAYGRIQQPSGSARPGPILEEEARRLPRYDRRGSEYARQSGLYQRESPLRHALPLSKIEELAQTPEGRAMLPGVVEKLVTDPKKQKSARTQLRRLLSSDPREDEKGVEVRNLLYKLSEADKTGSVVTSDVPQPRSKQNKTAQTHYVDPLEQAQSKAIVYARYDKNTGKYVGKSDTSNPLKTLRRNWQDSEGREPRGGLPGLQGIVQGIDDVDWQPVRVDPKKADVWIQDETGEMRPYLGNKEIKFPKGGEGADYIPGVKQGDGSYRPIRATDLVNLPIDDITSYLPRSMQHMSIKEIARPVVQVDATGKRVERYPVLEQLEQTAPVRHPALSIGEIYDNWSNKPDIRLMKEDQAAKGLSEALPTSMMSRGESPGDSIGPDASYYDRSGNRVVVQPGYIHSEQQQAGALRVKNAVDNAIMVRRATQGKEMSEEEKLSLISEIAPYHNTNVADVIALDAPRKTAERTSYANPATRVGWDPGRGRDVHANAVDAAYRAAATHQMAPDLQVVSWIREGTPESLRRAAESLMPTAAAMTTDEALGSFVGKKAPAEYKLALVAEGVTNAVRDLATMSRKDPEAFSRLNSSEKGGFTLDPFLKGYVRNWAVASKIADDPEPTYVIPVDAWNRMHLQESASPSELGTVGAIEKIAVSSRTPLHAVLRLDSLASSATSTKDDPNTNASPIINKLFLEADDDDYLASRIVNSSAQEIQLSAGARFNDLGAGRLNTGLQSPREMVLERLGELSSANPKVKIVEAGRPSENAGKVKRGGDFLRQQAAGIDNSTQEGKQQISALKSAAERYDNDDDLELERYDFSHGKIPGVPGKAARNFSLQMSRNPEQMADEGKTLGSAAVRLGVSDMRPAAAGGRAQVESNEEDDAGLGQRIGKEVYEATGNLDLNAADELEEAADNLVAQQFGRKGTGRPMSDAEAAEPLRKIRELRRELQEDARVGQIFENATRAPGGELSGLAARGRELLGGGGFSAAPGPTQGEAYPGGSRPAAVLTTKQKDRHEAMAMDLARYITGVARGDTVGTDRWKGGFAPDPNSENRPRPYTTPSEAMLDRLAAVRRRR